VPIRVAIVGPGKVGRAFGRRLHEAGAELLGFVGRRPGSAAEATRFCGAGRDLAVADLAEPHAVVFAVGDPDLPAAVAACVQAPPRSCSLWLHTSGRHDLSVLQPALPFADPAAGLRRLEGAPAVLLGDEAALVLLGRLCELLGLRALVAGPGDRRLYHAACALAANGLTALFDIVERVLSAYGGLQPGDGRDLAAALMRAALDGAAAQGPGPSLSGPVLRGDAATVAGHLDALEQAAPAAVPAYRALMDQALALAGERLPESARLALRRLLGPPTT
jgi:predicted short-subunit dehydrogenase-like oxidoreductase (DUF2520 family)